jgi:predicted O-methyltransferase YrrM
MKNHLSRFCRTIVGRDIIWALFDRSVNRIADYFTIQRQVALDVRARSLAAERGVLEGPFAGMRYGTEAFGSRLWPKLLGTYETELHAVLKSIIQNPPDCIVDVGCAEGYYAVGLALACPKSRIVAFDTAEHARNLTRELADANGASARVEIQCEFVVEKAAYLWDDASCLIICDTDGAESDIFHAKTIGHLRRCSLLIETHDYVREGITEELLKLFDGSHDAEVISSNCDYAIKSLNYRTSAFRETNRTLRGRFFEEGRPAPQKWIYLTPRRAT